MMISRALSVLLFFLNLNNTLAWDGCESAFAWRCGDKCIHGSLSNEQETMCKCGGVLFNKAALMWCCNNEPCDGKGTKRKDNTWLGERDNEGKVIGAECSGTPLKLTQSCKHSLLKMTSSGSGILLSQSHHKLICLSHSTEDCFRDIPELEDIIIPEPMKLIKAMRTIIRQVYHINVFGL